MSELGNAEKQEIGRWANNRVENSHLPSRRSERAMLRFRHLKSLQKFASVHANVRNHFNLERQLIDRETCRSQVAIRLTAPPVIPGTSPGLNRLPAIPQNKRVCAPDSVD